MLSAFLGQITGLFDKRFLFVVWFPSFLFGGATVFVATLAVGHQTALSTWSMLPVLTQVWLTIGALVLVTFFAYICDNLLGTLIRFYEGYWPDWANGLRHRRKGAHFRYCQHLDQRLALLSAQQRNMETAIELAEHLVEPSSESVPQTPSLDERLTAFYEALEKISNQKAVERPRQLISMFDRFHALRMDLEKQILQVPTEKTEWQRKERQLRHMFLDTCVSEKKRVQGEYGRLYAMRYLAFPKDESNFLPTRLGNVIRAAEEYGKFTYRLDTVTVWPRLVQQMQEDFRNRLERASTPLTTTLFCATLSFLFATIGGAVLFFVGSEWWLFVATVVGGLGLAAWCYESAVHHAIEYGMLIRTACDLYRHKLLRALDIPIPASPLEEYLLWPQLMKWWYYYNLPFDATTQKANWYYEEGKKPSPGAPKRDEHIVYLKLGRPPEPKPEGK